MTNWDEFPRHITPESPFIKAIEIVNEDTGEVISPDQLVEADFRRSLYVKWYPKDTDGKFIYTRGQRHTASKAGPWRPRWVEGKVINVEVKDKPQYPGYGMLCADTETPGGDYQAIQAWTGNETAVQVAERMDREIARDRERQNTKALHLAYSYGAGGMLQLKEYRKQQWDEEQLAYYRQLMTTPPSWLIDKKDVSPEQWSNLERYCKGDIVHSVHDEEVPYPPLVCNQDVISAAARYGRPVDEVLAFINDERSRGFDSKVELYDGLPAIIDHYEDGSPAVVARLYRDEDGDLMADYLNDGENE